MRKLDPKVIRVGDTVMVTNPEFFVRVGYPLTIDDMVPIAEEKIMPTLTTTLSKAGYGCSHGHREYDNLRRAVARSMLAAQQWGGRERKIYTIRQDFPLDQLYQVMNKFVVKTGERCPSYTDYEGETSPPYLAHEKTHVILELYPVYDGRKKVHQIVWDSLYYSIEQINVKKVHNAPEGCKDN